MLAELLSESGDTGIKEARGMGGRRRSQEFGSVQPLGAHRSPIVGELLIHLDDRTLRVLRTLVRSFAVRLHRGAQLNRVTNGIQSLQNYNKQIYYDTIQSI
jgi:hypothetical protein